MVFDENVCVFVKIVRQNRFFEFLKTGKYKRGGLVSEFTVGLRVTTFDLIFPRCEQGDFVFYTTLKLFSNEQQEGGFKEFIWKSSILMK